jgi:mannose-1-phosphate guanylyltransferase
MKNTYFVIMAGGKGERFWPLSTLASPKPFLRLLGSKTLLQGTVDRVRGLVDDEHILIVLGATHLGIAREQLPDLTEDSFLVEPAGRDTAPCIGYAATVLNERDPEAVMVVLPADHYIPDEDRFCETIGEAVDAARQRDFLVTVGIRPDRPETGYGYMESGAPCEGMPEGRCFHVRRFVEKPDEERARHYVESRRYLWNAGIFVWRTDNVLKALEQHMPQLSQGLQALKKALSDHDPEVVARLFHGFAAQSIDYGLMEKAENVLVIPGAFQWDDVGTWASLFRHKPADEAGNVSEGTAIVHDVHNCLIFADGVTVGAIGVSNLVIVATGQGVLVCDAGRAQEVRELARRASKGKGPDDDG